MSDIVLVKQWDVAQFVGHMRGADCNFPVRVLSRHPTLPHYLRCEAVAADNVWHVPDWIHVRDLRYDGKPVAWGGESA